MDSHKQILINICLLICGVGIGFVISQTQTHGTFAMQTADCSSIAKDPADEFLGAPIFRQPGTITSSKDGLILVRWLPVKGAKDYVVRVWDEAGREVKSFDSAKNYTYLKNLPVDPQQKQTPYWVVVTPRGETPDQLGKNSERKEVAMLPLRSLDPPTIKSIQTEREEQPKDEAAAKPQ